MLLYVLQDPLRALIFDSYYDPYRGVVCQFRVMDGKVSKGDTVVMMNTGKEYALDEIGVLAPVKTPVSDSDARILLYRLDIHSSILLLSKEGAEEAGVLTLQHMLSGKRSDDMLCSCLFQQLMLLGCVAG